MAYRVKNWRQFQHYRDRNPPWIKLHFAILSSTDWVTLDDASRVLAVACMLIASRNEGVIPSDPAYLKRVAYLNKTPNFKPLLECGFLEDASECKQMIADARPETETETEKIRLAPSGAFLRFWAAWPKHHRKQSQGKCWALWRQKDFDQVAQAVMSHVESLKASPDWQKEGGKYIPAPLVYLNQQRWEGAEVAPAEDRKVAL